MNRADKYFFQLNRVKRMGGNQVVCHFWETHPNPEPLIYEPSSKFTNHIKTVYAKQGIQPHVAMTGAAKMWQNI
eukprot:UN13233